MTKSDKFPMPSDSELRILKALWDRESATAKVINGHVYAGAKKPRVITTTLKQLEVMMEKGLVKRDDSRMPHVYRANVPKGAVLRRLVARTLNEAFDTSASQFMLAALEADAVSPADAAEIRAMLDEYQGERGNA